ncbi:serine/threonine protein phosphatase [Antarcticimicrobium sediminis]|uniref:Serine/threonine protein phosphatase n=2 Tax=Antarcticimicrobium sediminis TaxID=2546227 RepID=A0A4R5EWB1_9RHOB|nr:serine/threonine protein phosphatase [Antarcticimicrobium sediminis]
MPVLQPGQRLCVVGDVHGRIDLLDTLFDHIDTKAAQYGGIDKLVLLGDYIDRGEASAEVLQRLFVLCRDWPDQVVCLKGNHEQMLLDFLDDPERAGRAWLRIGGLQTLASFGVGHVSETSSAQALTVARDRLIQKLPDGIESWLRALPLTFQSGNLCAVHAALDPLLAVQDQPDKNLLWGCRQFRQVMRADGIWVIHGHTIVDDPEARDGVISVDTGAYATNQLSAAIIDPSGDIVFVQSGNTQR